MYITKRIHLWGLVLVIVFNCDTVQCVQMLPIHIYIYVINTGYIICIFGTGNRVVLDG